MTTTTTTTTTTIATTPMMAAITDMSLDPVKYEQSTGQQWQDPAQAWHPWVPTPRLPFDTHESGFDSCVSRSPAPRRRLYFAAQKVAAERMPEIVAIQEHQRKQTQTFLRSDRLSSRLAMWLLPLLAKSASVPLLIVDDLHAQLLVRASVGERSFSRPQA